MKHTVLTPHHIRRAEAQLSSADPVMAGIIKQVGRCRLGHSKREDPFIATIEAIVWQQLSGKAAATIYGRVLKLFPGGKPTPRAILAASPDAMRAAGLSWGKISYLKDLADESARRHRAHRRPRSPPGRRGHRDDDEGEGHRAVVGRDVPDVPAAARRRAPRRRPRNREGHAAPVPVFARRRKQNACTKIAECWRPYRSVGSWYLWASLDVVPGD